MAQGVSFSLYISIGAKFRIPAKEGYVQLNIEQSYYKLTLKASGLYCIISLHLAAFCIMCYSLYGHIKLLLLVCKVGATKFL